MMKIKAGCNCPAENRRHPRTAFQAAGLWERALEVAEANDAVNLSTTHHLYAQHLEKVPDNKETSRARGSMPPVCTLRAIACTFNRASTLRELFDRSGRRLSRTGQAETAVSFVHL